jgi:hypothetical protein
MSIDGQIIEGWIYSLLSSLHLQIKTIDLYRSRAYMANGIVKMKAFNCFEEFTSTNWSI